MERNDDSGTDWVEFARDELRISGGDYGTVVLEGLTPEARVALDALVAAARRGTGRVVVDGLVIECDDTPDLFEDRHAGREGTPERGVGPDSTDDESPDPSGSGLGAVKGPVGLRT